MIDLKLRVAKLGNEIWVDMCDEEWRSIKITKDGYEIVTKTPPLFRKYRHMEPLPEPKNDDNDDKKTENPTTPTHVSDGNDANDSSPQTLPPTPLTLLIEGGKRGEGGELLSRHPSYPSLPSLKYLPRLFQFINIPVEDRILLVAVLVSYFFVEYPFVAIALYGGKGRGKSTAAKILKSLIDPSVTRILDMPSKREELFQAIDHHYFIAFDNVSYISGEYSDVFCRVLTGVGTQKRMLYTDDDDFLRKVKRPIIFNGINVAMTREDLLDRTVLFEVLPIQNRRTEEEIYRDFEEIRPYILHELFVLVSRVLSILPEVEPNALLPGFLAARSLCFLTLTGES